MYSGYVALSCVWVSGDTGYFDVSVVSPAGVSESWGAGVDATDEGGAHPGPGGEQWQRLGLVEW